VSAAVAWFFALGRAPTPELTAEVEALLRRHPLLPGTAFACLDNWRDVARIVGAADWDSSWSDHEAEERERLWQRAAERISEDELFARVTAHTEAVAGAVRHAASVAAGDAGIDDSRLVTAASGDALMAVQHALLAREAGESDAHYLTCQYALHPAGRWPLGHHRRRFPVF
jgi:hypothetical protein